MRTLRIISSIAAAACALAVVAWVFWQNLVPSGVMTVHWRPGQLSRTVGPLVPESRVLPAGIADDGTPYAAAVSEPLNFDVRLPSAFEKAKVTVKLGGNAPLVEIGGLVSRENWATDLRPAANSILDRLTGWKKVSSGGLSLYERRPAFDSVESFLAALPNSGAAAYRADAGPKIRISGYVPSSSAASYAVPFRGATAIKAYLEDERLDFSWQVQEVNRHAGADGFSAAAYLGDKRIASAAYADDGNDSSDGRLSALRVLRLYTDKPITGMVRIELPAGDDVIFRSTAAKQRKFVFAGKFYAADNVGYLAEPAAFSVVTNARRIYATTTHPEAFQVLAAGSSKLPIDDLNKPFTASLAEDIRKSGLAAVSSAYGDLRLTAPGVFAFGEENFFNPDLEPLTWETDVDRDGIDYVLTSYVPPQKEGEWQVAQATFDLGKLSILNRSANFALSAPGIDLAQKELRIASIDVELSRPPLTAADIWHMVLKWWRQAAGKEKEYVNSLKN